MALRMQCHRLIRLFLVVPTRMRPRTQKRIIKIQGPHGKYSVRRGFSQLRHTQPSFKARERRVLSTEPVLVSNAEGWT